MGGRLTEKVALVTGGTSGIGRAIVLRFAAEGARVAFTGRRQDRGEALAAEVATAGGAARYLFADHARLEDCREAVGATLAAYGRVDILCNNAGLFATGTAESTTEDTWAEMLLVNVTAVWRMSRLVLPPMRAQGGGAIVNVASSLGLVARPNMVAYCAAKGAVVQMTRAMALDHARERIRVNSVCPADTLVERWATPEYLRRQGVDFETNVRVKGEALPIGRVAQPAEIAAAALFLASDESSFMTGAALAVDGGRTAY